MSDILATTSLTTPPSGSTNPLAGLVSRKNLASNLGVSWRTLLRAEHAGMPSVKVFGEVFYDPAAVREWLMQRAPKRDCRREPVTRGRPAGKRAA